MRTCELEAVIGSFLPSAIAHARSQLLLHTLTTCARLHVCTCACVPACVCVCVCVCVRARVCDYVANLYAACLRKGIESADNIAALCCELRLLLHRLVLHPRLIDSRTCRSRLVRNQTYGRARDKFCLPQRECASVSVSV